MMKVKIALNSFPENFRSPVPVSGNRDSDDPCIIIVDQMAADQTALGCSCAGGKEKKIKGRSTHISPDPSIKSNQNSLETTNRLKSCETIFVGIFETGKNKNKFFLEI